MGLFDIIYRFFSFVFKIIRNVLCMPILLLKFLYVVFIIIPCCIIRLIFYAIEDTFTLSKVGLFLLVVAAARIIIGVLNPEWYPKWADFALAIVCLVIFIAHFVYYLFYKFKRRFTNFIMYEFVKLKYYAMRHTIIGEKILKKRKRELDEKEARIEAERRKQEEERRRQKEIEYEKKVEEEKREEIEKWQRALNTYINRLQHEGIYVDTANLEDLELQALADEMHRRGNPYYGEYPYN